MTKKDAKAIREQLEELGWSQEKAAAELGIGLRTMQRYCSGEADVPQLTFLALQWLRQIHSNERVIEFIDAKGMRVRYNQVDVTDSTRERFAALTEGLKSEVKKVVRKRG